MKSSILYLRVSSERQVEGYSLDSQLDVCTREAAKLGSTVARIFREEGISAKRMDTRPELTKLLEYVKEHKPQYLIVYHSSRLARNSLDQLTIQAFLSKHGCTLHSCTEPISGDSPETKFLATVMSAVNQLDNEIKGRNVAASLKKRFLNGDITVKPPLGYKLIKNEGEKSHVVKDEVWFPIIKTMWRRIELEGLSLHKIARELTKYKIRKFTKGSVEHLFKNKFYAGYLVSEKYGETKGRHEPMISLDTYYKVLAMFKGRQLKLAHTMKFRDEFWLRGILKCGNCGKNLVSASSKGEYTKVGYYFCLNCEKRENLNSKKVHEALLGILKNICMDEETAACFEKLLGEEYHQSLSELEGNHDWVKKDIEDLNIKLKRAEDKLLEGVFTNDQYNRIKEEISIKLISRQTLLNENKMEKLDIESMKSFLKYYLQHLDSFFEKAKPEARFLLGSSIFPQKLVFEKGNYRTPFIERYYKIKDFIADKTSDRVSLIRLDSNFFNFWKREYIMLEPYFRQYMQQL